MPWDHPAPFIKSIIVQPADIDGLGHANNACYVQWCEQCAWEHSAQLGLSVTDYQKLDRGVAIHKADYHYFLPSLEGADLLVGTWLTACDRKLRLERRFQIIDPELKATVLRGNWLLICTTLSTGKATRFPPQFLQIYGDAAAAFRAE
jgi:acyl-CoA thioester hydrolase